MRRIGLLIKMFLAGFGVTLLLLGVTKFHFLFPLHDIYIAGRHQTPEIALYQAIKVKPGESLWRTDLKEMQRRIEALDWVKQVKIWRNLNGVLVISLDEYEAAAIWQNQGKYVLIARDGTVIIPVEKGHFSSLPLITGIQAPAAFDGLMHVADSWPDFARVLAGGSFAQGQRWTLYLSNGSQIYLPGKEILLAIERLRWLHERFQLLGSASFVIDLRAPDRAAIRENKDGTVETILLEERDS